METFVAETAAPIWKSYPALARACELSGLTPIQADATRLAVQGFSLKLIGETIFRPKTLLESPDAPYNVVRKAGKRLRARCKTRDRSERYWREVVTCFRNRKESGGSPVTLTGIMTSRLPWVEEPDIGFKEWRRRRQDPHNHQNVSLRGGVVTGYDLRESVTEPALDRLDALELLQFLARWISEHPEESE